MNTRIFLWAITSALAGFLFGFDTIVISGAEQTIQRLWGLSPGLHGLVMGSALYGTVLGSLFGTHQDMRNRTELLVILKPRVLRTIDDGRAVTEELRAKLRTLEPFRTQGRIP